MLITTKGEKMNKSQLTESMKNKANISEKNAHDAIDAIQDAITKALSEGDKVQLIGFGTFKVNDRAARKGRNPQTGAEIDIAASKQPAWKPSKGLLD